MASEKQLKILANQIAKIEKKIQSNRDDKAIQALQDEMIELVKMNELTLEDMMILDEMVQNILT